MTRRPAWFAALLVPALVASVALAGDGADPQKDGPKKDGPKKADPKKDGEPAKKEAAEKAKPNDYKGPEIAWVRNFAEARDESMERNVAVYVHSHGST